jgi:hypothetical protein
MKDIFSILSTGGWLAYLIVCFSAIPLFARGIFALKSSNSRNRKEFLELWKDGDKSDDFWLELMIRHCFGRALPAALVRRVMQLPASPAKLADLAASWSWFDYDQREGRLDWKVARRRGPKRSTLELRLSYAIYGTFAFVGLMIVQKVPVSSHLFIWGVICVAFSIPFMFHIANLSIALDTFKELSPLLANTGACDAEGLRVAGEGETKSIMEPG